MLELKQFILDFSNGWNGSPIFLSMSWSFSSELIKASLSLESILSAWLVELEGLEVFNCKI